MKIAIACQGPRPEDAVSEVFARCEHFHIFDSESGSSESHANRFKDQEHGAGPKVAQWLADQGVGLLVSGKVGPQAQRVLDAAGLKVALRRSGSARDAFEALRSGAGS